jgi:hypothetical protein
MTPTRVIRKPGHPLAYKDGRIKEHRFVLYEKIGPGPHACHWCGREIQWMPGGRAAFRDRRYLVPDHLDTNPLNNAPGNLVPSCVPCNSSRGCGGRGNEILREILGRPNRRGIIPKKYKRIAMPDHPLADRQGCVQEHQLVLWNKVGPGDQPCHWCGKILHWGKGRPSGSNCLIIPDHLDGTRLNNVPENLVPSCFKCNIDRGRTDRVGDDELFITAGNARHRAEERECSWCKKKFLIKITQLKSRPGIDGKFCSNSCCMSDTLARQHGHTADTLFGYSNAGKKFKAERRICQECGKEFLFPVSMGPFTPGRFCSRSCASTFNNRPRRKANKRSLFEPPV